METEISRTGRVSNAQRIPHRVTNVCKQDLYIFIGNDLYKVKISTILHQKNVKETVINNNFDATLPVGKYTFSTNKRNFVRIHALKHLTTKAR